MAGIEDHPLRYELSNELHARPFPTLDAPCFAVFLALKQPRNAAERDRKADRDHLIALLDRFGAQHPKPGATHWYGELGRFRLKWEQHTEFVTYTLFGAGVAERPFDGDMFRIFPESWLADAPGVRITSALIRVEEWPESDGIDDRLAKWFVPESLAVSAVLDRSALVASDFRIDPGGHTRMAVFTAPGIGSRRIGRIVQRLCEIEIYKAMSMLGLLRVRDLSPRLSQLDRDLSELMRAMTGGSRPETTLKALLDVSAEIEAILAQTSFRFGATGAYEALVNQRIEVLRETTYEGRSTLGEFMMRRFDPAMRTVKATRTRLQGMSDRAIRAGELLRTRVDVERSAQNQLVLESMDRRAGTQLRLQRTVEGLSVVAISYYALNLAVYMAAPLFDATGLSKTAGTAMLAPVVILLVWGLLRHARRHLE